MFAVSACLRNQVTPTTSNLEAVKKIFKYLKGQPKLGLWYPRKSPFVLEAYSDSDYTRANKDRKYTTGGCQFLGRRLISWYSGYKSNGSRSSSVPSGVPEFLLVVFIFPTGRPLPTAEVVPKSVAGSRFPAASSTIKDMCRSFMCSSQDSSRLDVAVKFIFQSSRYVVPTGGVVVPTGRYKVPVGKVIIIVSTGRLSLVPTGRVLSPGRIK
ncbi:hypothetical protein Tco_0659921 [Tanacetum coccineum]